MAVTLEKVRALVDLEHHIQRAIAAMEWRKFHVNEGGTDPDRDSRKCCSLESAVAIAQQNKVSRRSGRVLPTISVAAINENEVNFLVSIHISGRGAVQLTLEGCAERNATSESQRPVAIGQCHRRGSICSDQHRIGFAVAVEVGGGLW